MDRNQFIGLILMFALLAVYFTWFAPDPPAVTEETQKEITEPKPQLDSVSVTIHENEVNTSDSIRNVRNYEKYGVFAFAVSDNEEATTIENEDMIIAFNSLGGKIEEVTLKKHKDYLGNNFKIIEKSKSDISLMVDYQGSTVDLTDLFYTKKINKKGDTTEITYSLSNGDLQIQHNYVILPKGFEIIYQLKTSGLNSVLSPTDASFQWNHAINLAEKTLEDSRLNANIRYYLSSNNYDQLTERSDEFEEATLGSPIKWVSFKQKFFTTAVIANTAFSSGYVNQKVNDADTTSVKDMAIALAIPYSEFIQGFSMRYYFGTNKYNTLKKVAPEFEENLDMGWGPLPIINKFLIIPIFDLLQKFIKNYGLIIIILVIFIRLILSPLTYKSHMSMAKMRVMKPELDEIKEKHGGDMQKMQQDQMKLYQQVGINPLSGCIPVLLQMPIFFSLFFFFPNAVDLRGESFLWAKDLSTYDSIINLPFEIPFYGDHVSLFTLLMTLSTILYTWSNSQIATVQGPMKTLQYIMPIMFLFVLNSYASGLTFYYFVSNMATFGQTLLFRKFIDEDKIHLVLQENRKKNANKKKSKFQQRLEDAMKANQETQRNRKKRK
ncbi:MAG: membrane protein insertase YidC [Bacteroidota bacterium]